MDICCEPEPGGDAGEPGGDVDKPGGDVDKPGGDAGELGLGTRSAKHCTAFSKYLLFFCG